MAVISTDIVFPLIHTSSSHNDPVVESGIMILQHHSYSLFIGAITGFVKFICFLERPGVMKFICFS